MTCWQIALILRMIIRNNVKILAAMQQHFPQLSNKPSVTPQLYYGNLRMMPVLFKSFLLIWPLISILIWVFIAKAKNKYFMLWFNLPMSLIPILGNLLYELANIESAYNMWEAFHCIWNSSSRLVLIVEFFIPLFLIFILNLAVLTFFLTKKK